MATAASFSPAQSLTCTPTKRVINMPPPGPQNMLEITTKGTWSLANTIYQYSKIEAEAMASQGLNNRPPYVYLHPRAKMQDTGLTVPPNPAPPDVGWAMDPLTIWPAYSLAANGYAVEARLFGMDMTQMPPVEKKVKTVETPVP
jgi:hypothetical protein